MVKELIAQASEIKGVHTGDLLARRNVVGVGLGYKFSRGVSTGEVSLVVSVTHKVDASALSAQDLVPKALDGVKTDVIPLGVLRAQQADPRDRWRPVVPGVSVGHSHVTAGTFGCLVRRGEETFLLSNNHVLADVNEGRAGDPILQPATADGGVADDRVAMLADYVPLDFGVSEAECPVAEWSAVLLTFAARVLGSGHELKAVKQTPGVNLVDAALARPLSPDLAKKDILHIGAPTGVGEADLAMAVQKTGRTTGHTRGTITQVDATVRIDYEGRSALFSGQLVASPMSQGGDSGSAVLDMGGNVVGLLFAGSDAATIINPIGEVFSALNVELA